MADPADINVDELRRRARRRLVGAIVLALGAAVIVPMLLESEPKPLGESVAVKIPPVDDGKFVNRLNEAAPAPADSAAPGATDAARKSLADAEKSVVAPATRTSKYDTQIAPGNSPATPPVPAETAPKAGAADKEAKPEPKGEVRPPAKAESKSESKAPPRADARNGAAAPARSEPANEAKAPARSEPKSESPHEPRSDAKASDTPPAAGAPAKDGFSVQLAAFSDDKGANALASRLKRAGYPAYTEPLKTSRGTLWRVRVGPYPSRDAANGVRDKLKAEGQSGIVAPSR